MMMIKNKRLIFVIVILLLTFSSFRATSKPLSEITLAWYPFFPKNVILGWKIVEFNVKVDEPILLGRERLAQDDIIQISISNGLPTNHDEIASVSAFMLLNTFLNGEKVEKQDLNDSSLAPSLFVFIMPIKVLVDNIEMNTSTFLEYSDEITAKIQGDYMIVQDNEVLAKFQKNSGILYEVILEIPYVLAIRFVYSPEASNVDITGNPTSITDNESANAIPTNSASTPGFDIILLVVGIGLLVAMSRLLSRKNFHFYLRGRKNGKNGEYN
ncbi:MAG: hypothetical protein ACFFDT_15935 [Candidatus Hodarchaeota archaeon]